MPSGKYQICRPFGFADDASRLPELIRAAEPATSVSNVENMRSLIGDSVDDMIHVLCTAASETEKDRQHDAIVSLVDLVDFGLEYHTAATQDVLEGNKERDYPGINSSGFSTKEILSRVDFLSELLATVLKALRVLGEVLNGGYELPKPAIRRTLDLFTKQVQAFDDILDPFGIIKFMLVVIEPQALIARNRPLLCIFNESPVSFGGVKDGLTWLHATSQKQPSSAFAMCAFWVNTIEAYIEAQEDGEGDGDGGEDVLDVMENSQLRFAFDDGLNTTLEEIIDRDIPQVDKALLLLATVYDDAWRIEGYAAFKSNKDKDAAAEDTNASDKDSDADEAMDAADKDKHAAKDTDAADGDMDGDAADEDVHDVPKDRCGVIALGKWGFELYGSTSHSLIVPYGHVRKLKVDAPYLIVEVPGTKVDEKIKIRTGKNKKAPAMARAIIAKAKLVNGAGLFDLKLDKALVWSGSAEKRPSNDGSSEGSDDSDVGDNIEHAGEGADQGEGPDGADQNVDDDQRGEDADAGFDGGFYDDDGFFD